MRLLDKMRGPGRVLRGVGLSEGYPAVVTHHPSSSYSYASAGLTLRPPLGFKTGLHTDSDARGSEFAGWAFVKVGET